MDWSRAEKPPQRAAKASALSYLGLSIQPINESNALELNESDLVWSYTNEERDMDNGNGVESTSPSSVVSATESPTATVYDLDRKNGERRYGLSAVLAAEDAAMVRRKASPSSIGMTMTTGVRTIPRSRKGSPSSDGSVGCGRWNMSAPVSIPVWGRMRRFEEEEVDEDEDGQLLPPHEVVAARSQTTFSVFEGVGRTLKGRDLRRVTNAVFQQTGFLD